MFCSLSAIIHATRPVAVVFALAAALAAHAQAPPSPPLPPIGPNMPPSGPPRQLPPLVETAIFKGRILDGSKPLANLFLVVDAKSLKLQHGSVSNGKIAEFLHTGESGEIFAHGLPVFDAGANRSKATFYFDRNGKLARGARRVFGIVRTEQGQEFKFEANLWELPPPGNERDPRRP